MLVDQTHLARPISFTKPKIMLTSRRNNLSPTSNSKLRSNRPNRARTTPDEDNFTRILGVEGGVLET